MVEARQHHAKHAGTSDVASTAPLTQVPVNVSRRHMASVSLQRRRWIAGARGMARAVLSRAKRGDLRPADERRKEPVVGYYLDT
jgi:hypothetical protein